MDKCTINITAHRKEYMQNKLRRKDLTSNPIELFEQWFVQACSSQISEANAMSISTVDKNGQPYQRLVLLKHFDVKSMIFYTNLSSRKAYHLAHNPRVSLHFPWHKLERQVLVLGQVERLPVDDVIKYFYSRPRDSQISAWVSKQSHPIPNRITLENKFLELKQKFKYNKVPFPYFWGGYRVIIDAIEFWQGGKNRLHDRFFYQRKDNKWQIDRLSP